MSIFLFSSQLLLLPCLGPKEASGHNLDHHPLHHSQGPVEGTSSLPPGLLAVLPLGSSVSQGFFRCWLDLDAENNFVAIQNLTKAVSKLVPTERARPGYQQSHSKLGSEGGWHPDLLVPFNTISLAFQVFALIWVCLHCELCKNSVCIFDSNLLAC